MVKNLPAMRKTWVRSLGWEDPLEKGMATHSSILAWRIPWTEQPGRLQSMGSQSWTQLNNLHFHFHIYIYRERVKNEKREMSTVNEPNKHHLNHMTSINFKSEE